MECPRCHDHFNDGPNIEAIQEWGECLGCDHIEGELLGEQQELVMEMED
jgi:hypothetical protein